MPKDELFSIAPNPVTGKTVLKNDAGLFVKQITVTDISGKTIAQNKVESSGALYSVNCTTLASGNYLLAIEYTDSNTKEKTQTIKFTKQ